MKQALFSPEYRGATWTCFVLGITNQFSAIAPLVIFSSTLIAKMREVSGGSFPLTVKDGVLLIAICNFVAASLAAIPSAYFGRKTLLLAGHVGMMVTHLLIGVFMRTEQYTALFAFVLLFLFVF